MDDIYLKVLAAQVEHALAERGLVLATAESCTGGWIAKLITDIPGSSVAFDCGFVTYSNEAKMALLGVAAALIATHGAVSREVVSAMACGALVRSRADVVVAVSGIAGPGGGSPEKPVGTVWIAWAGRGHNPDVIQYHFEGDRDSIRREAAGAALEGVVERFEKDFFRPVAGT